MRHTSTIRLTVDQLDEGGYLARSPDVPGLLAESDTPEGCVEVALRLIDDLVQFWNDEGVDLPPALANGVTERRLELRLAVGVEDGR